MIIRQAWAWQSGGVKDTGEDERGLNVQDVCRNGRLSGLVRRSEGKKSREHENSRASSPTQIIIKVKMRGRRAVVRICAASEEWLCGTVRALNVSSSPDSVVASAI